MTLRAIDPSSLRERYAGPASKVGERPELQVRTQRGIGRQLVERKS